MQNTKKGKKPIGRRILTIVCCVLAFVFCVLGILQTGTWYTENAWKRWSPAYERVDISPLLDKSELSEADYETLYRQTGLTRLAIDDMRQTSGGKNRILEIQNALFAEVSVQPLHFAPFTYIEEIDGENYFCDLKEGDIIVTATTRVSWWRYGHAAIVVKGGTNAAALLAESFAPGENSSISSVSSYNCLGDFLVYRPKADATTKRAVVDYIQAEMMGIPYGFTVGILSKKNPKTLKSTQCAHFVWYAYKQFGIDLDGNGGALVKPQDIANSDEVELVQAYGFDLDKLWS